MRAWTLVLLGAFMAMQVIAQLDAQSEPFNLVLTSTNDSINGAPLYPCHEGAAIEALCPDCTIKLLSFNDSLPTYNLNYSSNAVATSPGGITGDLVWDLPYNGNESASSAMQLPYNPSSNVAVPLFFPGSGFQTQQVAFDECDNMNIQAYVDDTTSPPTPGKVTAYYRWYVCTTIPTSYIYTTLAWLLGHGEPENPTCQKVNVRRLFA